MLPIRYVKETIDEGVIDIYSNKDKHHDLLAFAKAIHRKRRDLFFVDVASRNSRFLKVCAVGQFEMLGEIQIVTPVSGPNKYKEVYRVHSRRYMKKRGERFLKDSKDLATAVKTAVKYLKPRSIDSLVDSAIYFFNDARGKIINPTASKLRQVRGDLYGGTTGHTDELQYELITLYEAGYMFKSPHVRDSVAQIIQLTEELEQIATDNPPAVDLVIPVVGSEYKLNMYMVVRLCPISESVQSFRYHYDERVAVLTVNYDKLPHHIKDNIPLVTMTEQGQYVEGVGMMTRDGNAIIEIRE